MHRNIFAYTAPGFEPEYVSINQQTDGTFTLDARGPASSDGKLGQTVRVTLSVKQLAMLAKALVCEVIPADLA